MPKPDTSALVDAAAAFETELAAYTRLGKLFVATPLASVKHLERANTTLSEIAACEGRLQTAGQNLVMALASARQDQEQLAKQVVEHVPVVQARNQQLQQLMGELTAVATEVGGLNEQIAARTSPGDGALPAVVDAQGISASVFELSMRAEQLATRARAAELEELATQAHALHQKLLVVGKKLALAGQG